MEMLFLFCLLMLFLYKVALSSINMTALSVMRHPQRHFLALIHSLITVSDGSFSTAITPMQANVPVPTATDTPFTYIFTGLEPTGTYTWLAALMEPGTLNVIGTMASQTFTFAL